MSAHSDPESTIQPVIPANRKRKPAPNGKANGAAETEVNLQELLGALQAMKAGDFSIRMRSDQLGMAGKIADAFNDIAATNQRMADQLEKVGEQVGRQGKTRQRVKFGLSAGAWGEMESSVN